jgi:hypothetical protein
MSHDHELKGLILLPTFDAMSIKIPITLFTEIGKFILQFTWNLKCFFPTQSKEQSWKTHMA